MTEYYTYRIVNSITGQSYFGSTRDLKLRWSGHKECSKAKNRPLYIDMREIGIENFYMERLGTYNSKEESRIAEDLLIKSNPTNYNLYCALQSQEKSKNSQRDYQQSEKSKNYQRDYQRKSRQTEEYKQKSREYRSKHRQTEEYKKYVSDYYYKRKAIKTESGK